MIATLPLETLGVFFLASLALALAPGPDILFVLTQAALHGPGAGWRVTLGLCTGLLGHTLAVALGVAVLFQTSAFAFGALRAVGAGYLVFLAWQELRAFRRAAEPEAGAPELRARSLYARGIVMNLTNPKVSLFFLAFLPQFADPARGSLAAQLVQLGGVFIVATALVFGTVAAFAGTIGGWLRRSPGVQRALHAIAAAIFLSLAVALLVQH